MKNSKVFLNGLEVGEVKGLSVSQNRGVEAVLALDNSISISKDSKFILGKDLLAVSTITIRPGTDTDYLTSGQKIKGQLEEPAKHHDHGLAGLIDRFIVTGQANQDSILIELRRLNDNLEHLMNNSK